MTGDKLRLLDLYCGAGGAGMGYHRAGFEVVGVDIRPMPHYPFEFHQGEALEYLGAHWREFDAFHASPPCQAYTWASARWGHENYPDLLYVTRSTLEWMGKPYQIENVIGAPLKANIELCGTMFGLRVFRHRRFETSWMCFQPTHPGHDAVIGFGDDDFVTVAGHGGDGSARLDRWQRAMDIDWMDKEELAEAIPPAYTEYIGKQLMNILTTKAGAE